MPTLTPPGETHTYEQIQEFGKTIAWFLENNYSFACLDEADDIEAVAEGLAQWLLGEGREADLNTEFELPKGTYRNEFNIVDNNFNPPRHVGRFTLHRRPGMDTQQFMKLQNDMYVIMGKAVLASPAHMAMLRGMGVEITIVPPEDGGAVLPVM